MNVLTFGSLNIDQVYHVPHVVHEHETLASETVNTFLGGKGFNQSIAARCAYAGKERSTRFLHAGCIGAEGAELRNELKRRGIEVHFVHIVSEPNGHAIIQVTPSGTNAIIIHGGANRAISDEHIKETLDFCSEGDCIILQNEINAVPDIIERAAERRLRIFFNAAPCSAAVAKYPLHLLDTLCVNEVEGEMLAGTAEPRAILDKLTNRYPQSAIIVTVGEKGAWYGRAAQRFHAPAFEPPAAVVDTTAAGDTFFGYYVSLIAQGRSTEEAMRTACAAAALSVTRAGALPSIPHYEAVAGVMG